jgi:hypothetical protein
MKSEVTHLGCLAASHTRAFFSAALRTDVCMRVACSIFSILFKFLFKYVGVQRYCNFRTLQKAPEYLQLMIDMCARMRYLCNSQQAR